MFVRPARPRPGASPEPATSARTSTRMCVGCRATAERTVLLRLVVRAEGDGLSVVPDPRRRMPGRGANIHPDPACLELALRRKAFGRAFRVAAALDTRAVAAYLAAATRSGRHEDDQSTSPSQTESGFTAP